MEKSKQPVEYQNNPFYIALDGLKLLFKNAQSVAILLVVLCAVGLVGNMVPDASYSTDDSRMFQGGMPSIEPGMIAIVAIIIATIAFAIIVFYTIVYAIMGHTAAKLADDKTTTLDVALKDGFSNFWGFLWLIILMYIKLVLWTLLFVIPGIYMSIRYSMATVAYFAEGKRGNDAIKRSLELTGGAWLTTFASQSLFNLMTLGVLQPLLTPGTDGVLYRQLKHYTDTKQKKPNAHWLSWFTLALLIGIVLLLLAVVALTGWAIYNFSTSGFGA